MDVQPQNLEMTYHLASSEMDDTIAQINNAQQGEQALKQWSRTVENAVDRVICLQHKLDPLKKSYFLCLPMPRADAGSNRNQLWI